MATPSQAVDRRRSVEARGISSTAFDGRLPGQSPHDASVRRRNSTTSWLAHVVAQTPTISPVPLSQRALLHNSSNDLVGQHASPSSHCAYPASSHHFPTPPVGGGGNNHSATSSMHTFPLGGFAYNLPPSVGGVGQTPTPERALRSPICRQCSLAQAQIAQLKQQLAVLEWQIKDNQIIESDSSGSSHSRSYRDRGSFRDRDDSTASRSPLPAMSLVALAQMQDQKEGKVATVRSPVTLRPLSALPETQEQKEGFKVTLESPHSAQTEMPELKELKEVRRSSLASHEFLHPPATEAADDLSPEGQSLEEVLRFGKFRELLAHTAVAPDPEDIRAVREALATKTQLTLDDLTYDRRAAGSREEKEKIMADDSQHEDDATHGPRRTPPKGEEDKRERGLTDEDKRVFVVTPEHSPSHNSRGSAAEISLSDPEAGYFGGNSLSPHVKSSRTMEDDLLGVPRRSPKRRQSEDDAGQTHNGTPKSRTRRPPSHFKFPIQAQTPPTPEQKSPFNNTTTNNRNPSPDSDLSRHSSCSSASDISTHSPRGSEHPFPSPRELFLPDRGHSRTPPLLLNGVPERQRTPPLAVPERTRTPTPTLPTLSPIPEVPTPSVHNMTDLSCTPLSIVVAPDPSMPACGAQDSSSSLVVPMNCSASPTPFTGGRFRSTSDPMPSSPSCTVTVSPSSGASVSLSPRSCTVHARSPSQNLSNQPSVILGRSQSTSSFIPSSSSSSNTMTTHPSPKLTVPFSPLPPSNPVVLRASSTPPVTSPHPRASPTHPRRNSLTKVVGVLKSAKNLLPFASRRPPRGTSPSTTTTTAPTSPTPQPRARSPSAEKQPPAATRAQTPPMTIMSQFEAPKPRRSESDNQSPFEKENKGELDSSYHSQEGKRTTPRALPPPHPGTKRPMGRSRSPSPAGHIMEHILKSQLEVKRAVEKREQSGANVYGAHLALNALSCVSRWTTRIQEFEDPTAHIADDYHFDIFLGGACNPTTWRQTIAIPLCTRENISYYNPQVENWTPDLVQIEAQAKEDSYILLFIVSAETRAMASLVEASEYISSGRNVILVVTMLEYGQSINNIPLSKAEVDDLNRARRYLIDVCTRFGVLRFPSVEAGLQECVDQVRARRVRQACMLPPPAC